MSARKLRKFIPPTLKEAEEYVRLRNLSVDPKHFIEHYEDANPPWHDKYQQPLVNWKQKMLTWHRRNLKKGRPPKCWCGNYGVYYGGVDSAGYPYFICIDHKPKPKTIVTKDQADRILKQVPQSDNRSFSDKRNEQLDKLKGSDA